MTNRFQQDLDAIRIKDRDGQPAWPVTTYRGLVKRLGLASEGADVQFKYVQEWVDHGNPVNRSLFLSLEEAGIKFPLESGAAQRWR